MNVCCLGESVDVDICLYLCGISFRNVPDLSNEDQTLVLDIYKHLASCQKCGDYYKTFKKEMVNGNYGDDQKAIFSPGAFGLIRKNEKYLDNLVSQ